MLNLKFSGSVNMFYRFSKEKIFFTTGMKNLYFFLYFLKKYFKTSNIYMNFYFIKQKSKPIMILKSPIQYKISKHLITKHKNPFILKINIPYKSEFMNIFDCI